MLTLYAGMRDGRQVLMCDFDNLQFLVSVCDRFTESDHIEKFYITKPVNNDVEVIFEKYLEVKTKPEEVVHRRAR